MKYKNKLLKLISRQKYYESQSADYKKCCRKPGNRSK